MSFEASTPLEQAVYAGQYESVVSILRCMSVPERTAHRNSVLHMLNIIAAVRWSPTAEQNKKWGATPSDAQARAAGAAIFLCGTAADVAKHYDNVEDLVALGLAYKPHSLAGLSDALLADSFFRIWDVQQLITAGLVSRPTSERYATALIELPRRLKREETFDVYLEADPGLASVLLCIMDVEGTSEINLAAADKYSKGYTWSQILRSMCARDTYSRAQLIDKTLAGLERDWLQFRSGWFSRFHSELAPSIDEMRQHAGRYLSLCLSRIPPTVTFALGMVKILDEDTPFETAALLDAVRPVLTSGVKAHVLTGLTILDRVVRRDAAAGVYATAIASAGLAHESADVQKQVLVRLAKWGIRDELRATLTELSAGVAAVNRKVLDTLIGKTTTKSEPEPKPQLLVPAKRCNPIDIDRRLEKIDDINELVERIAYVFENDADIDEFERAMAALVRMAPLSLDVKKRFDPVAKRAIKVTKPVASELARVLFFVLSGVRRISTPTRSLRDGSTGVAEQYLIDRVTAAIDVAAQCKGLTPLSAPTHQRGFIEPVDLVARIQMHQRKDFLSPILEQVQCILRLPAERNEPALLEARALSATPFVMALRYALGDDIEPTGNSALLAAAARIRYPNSDDAQLHRLIGDQGPDAASCARYAWRISVKKSDEYTWRCIHLTAGHAPEQLAPAFLAVARHPSVSAVEEARYSRWRFAGNDPGVIMYTATMLPSSLENFFAEGADAIGNNLDWSEARWETSEYLRPLLDSTVPMTPMATLLLALTLAAKEPGQSAIGVDAFVQSWRDCRIDINALGKVA